jgi:anti-sigma regulatory factor (Ser/Thr protein kinase)
MQSETPGRANGRAGDASANGTHGSEIDRLRMTCRRQRVTIDKLRDVIAVLRRGGSALKGENHDLRAENARIRCERGTGRDVAEQAGHGRRVEVCLAVDAQAPAAARRLVADCLGQRVAPTLLANAQLVMSELVGNGVRHSAARPGEGLGVSVEFERMMWRLEVEDPGRAGAVAPRRPDLEDGGGLGLHIVQELSERWGVERVATGGTRVWAYLERAPLPGHDHGEREDEAERVATQL